MRAADVARYTALHVPAGGPPTEAATRLVSLGRLLGQRAWPAQEELLERLSVYGVSHGAWDAAEGYTEASLARVVEAAGDRAPALPSVSATPGFLCGQEFDSLEEELGFFAARGLSLAEVEIEVDLQPGELLVFDNGVLAHGRRGRRRPGELRQRVFGHRALEPEGQERVRDRVLAAFVA